MKNPIRNYVTLASGKQIHYRQLGSGPPLIMLHPSPQCSEALLPAMQVYSNHVSCIAFDTPGYGLSDDIEIESPHTDDYVDTFIEAITLLNIDKFALYGVATGAQLAISIAKAYPERTLQVMLDTNGHLDEAEKNETLKGYMPLTTPNRSGGHLLIYWDMVRSLFLSFPWQASSAEQRLKVDMPPAEIIHSIFLRYLNAGENYKKAYKAAFDTEHVDHLDGLTVPTSIMRWKGSIVLSMTDALINFKLPDNFKILHAEPTLEDRFKVQIQHLTENYLNKEFSPPDTISTSELTMRAYVGEENKLHIRQNLSGAGKPVFVFHDLGQSSRQILDLTKPLIGKRPFYAVDLPGHGGSTLSPENTFQSFVSYCEFIKSSIIDLPYDDADIIGIGFGGMVATNLCASAINSHLILIDVFDKAFAEELDLSPSHDASHLIRAWSKVFNSEFYHPWNQATEQASISADAEINPQKLHSQAHDLLILGSQYPALKSFENEFNWSIAMREITQRTRIGHSPRQSKMSKASLLESDSDAINLSSDKNRWLEELGVIQ